MKPGYPIFFAILQRGNIRNAVKISNRVNAVVASRNRIGSNPSTYPSLKRPSSTIRTRMENREIARLLSETADLMEIAAEDGFRIRSFRNAAGVIEGYPERVADIACNPDRKLTDVPGIGKGIAGIICDILEKGSFDKRDQLLQKYPPTALELLKIQGLGPKSIALLIEHFRVSTIDDLERLCQEQKLRTLPRMGAKLEEKVLRSIQQYRSSAGRFLLPFARRMADELVEYLSTTPGVEKVTAAGSLRRGRETVGDLDLMVTGPDPGPALERFVQFARVHEILGRGENKASAKVGLEGIQVDVRALPAESYGAAMQYFTGSKDHNVALRQRALKMGLTLNEYGLFRIETNERVASATEEEIYQALDLAWIPPELRENCGEIEAAAERRLPVLVQASDVRGDLHMHTTQTDGRATLEEMAEHARALGYEYVAITDHSKALAMANGLDEARVIAFAKEVRERNQDGLPLRVFSGIECDILKDGTMDLANDALAELDIVIGSVHSFMNLEPAEMTDRLLRALECPSLRVLGHLTGRLLLHREGYQFDFEKIAAEAARRGVWLEINASPERLDIYGPLLRTAKAKGCKFTISTDAHHPKHLLNMPYGVLMARRGWLSANDVMNTRPVEEFTKALHK
jgi:DNA polymerase (family X)